MGIGIAGIQDAGGLVRYQSARSERALCEGIYPPAIAQRFYVALMSDLMLTRLGVTAGDLVVEGSLAANPAYAALLAAFRPSQQVFAGSDAAGTARGAALLAKWPSRNFQAPPLIAASPCAIEGLHAYRNAWTKAVLET